MSIETEKNRGPTQWEAGKATQKRAIRASPRMPRRCLRPVHAVQCYLVNWGEPTTSTETCEPWYARIKEEYKTDLKKEMLFFSTVETIDLQQIRWSAIRFQRNNNTYRMLVSLCQLIVEGMLMATESGEYKLATFIDEQRMCRLYEKFILEYYAKECPQVKATSSRINWALDDGVGTYLPMMQSDIMLTKGNQVLIVDAKYYTHNMQNQYDSSTIISGNLYQIFTYVKNKEAEFGDADHSVSGMLLYAKTDEQIQPDGDYQMSGNRISVKTLDLNRDFSEIAEQLNGIVHECFG